MALPTWLPGFTRAAHPLLNLDYSPAYDTKAGKAVAWPLDAKPCLVLHSTEGDGLPGYNGGKANPHLTVDPWQSKKYQHVPCNVASRALAGSDRETHCHAIQVEIVGWCDFASARSAGKDKTRLLDVLTAKEREWLGQTLQEIGAACGIPAKTSVTFKAYNSGIAPSSYGTSNGVRLSKAAFLKYAGWLGHQHVPFNVHGDPGNLDVAALLKVAKPTPAPKPDPAPSKARVLKLGDTGDDVKRLQQGMQRVFPTYAPKAADGSYGPDTQRAVREFQSRTGIEVDGICGPGCRAEFAKYGVTF